MNDLGPARMRDTSATDVAIDPAPARRRRRIIIAAAAGAIVLLQG